MINGRGMQETINYFLKFGNAKIEKVDFRNSNEILVMSRDMEKIIVRQKQRNRCKTRHRI